MNRIAHFILLLGILGLTACNQKIKKDIPTTGTIQVTTGTITTVVNTGTKSDDGNMTDEEKEALKVMQELLNE